MQQKQLQESGLVGQQQIQQPQIRPRASAADDESDDAEMLGELEEEEEEEEEPPPSTARKTPGRVTRVVGDLMVFAEVDEDGPIGLVFMPDVIADYHGEPLQDIGIVVGAPISQIEWDTATRLVSSVVLLSTGGAPLRAA